MSESGVSVKPVVWCVFAAAYAVLSLFVMGRYLIASNLGDTWRGATVSSMVDGTAERPYVYRRLIPAMTVAVQSLMPASLQESIGAEAAGFAQGLPVAQAFATQKRMFRTALEDTGAFFTRTIAAALAYGFLWMFIVALYRLSAVLFPNNPAMALCTPVIGLLVVPVLLVPTAFMYDLPAMGLAAAAYYTMAVKRWQWFWLWFVLACINKETAMFISLFFALFYYQRMDRRSYIMLLGLQFAVFALLRGVIYLQFMENPGIFLNTSYVAQQTSMWLDGYGYKTLAAIFFIVFLLTFNWQQKPPFARMGMALLVLMYAAYFLFGRPDEYRVFLDIWPLLAVLATHTLVECTGLARHGMFNPAPVAQR